MEAWEKWWRRAQGSLTAARVLEQGEEDADAAALRSAVKGATFIVRTIRTVFPGA